MRWFRAAALALALVGCSSGGGDSLAPASSPPAGDPPPAPPTPPGDPPPAPPVTAMFVLGDSLSDIGNAAGLADYALNLLIEPPTVGLCNPHDVLVVPRPCDDLFYRQRSVTDGPVAVERLAAELDLPELAPSFHVVPTRPSRGTNYAVASAKARGADVEDLAQQIDRLLLDHGPLAADELYVVMIGGNDAIDALQTAVAGGGADASSAIVTAAVDAIGASVERLLDFGARRIVVANVPDLSTLPAVVASANASSNAADVLAAASAVSNAFDVELDAVLDGIEDVVVWTPAPVIVRFDLRAALQAAQQSIAAAGGNSRDACFDSENYRQTSTAERSLSRKAPGTRSRAGAVRC